MRNKSCSIAAIGKIILTLALGAPSALTWAAGTHGGGHGHDQDSGHGHSASGHGAMMMGAPGKAADVGRTIEVTMFDNYYQPESITVAKGETVLFKIRNAGQLVHEFNIGSPEMHEAHQKEMMMMVEHGALLPDRIDHQRMKMDMGGGKTMEHTDPNSTLLEPGQSAELIWKFPRAGEIEFACNVPGHYAAGMVGHVELK